MLTDLWQDVPHVAILFNVSEGLLCTLDKPPFRLIPDIISFFILIWANKALPTTPQASCDAKTRLNFIAPQQREARLRLVSAGWGERAEMADTNVWPRRPIYAVSDWHPCEELTSSCTESTRYD
jgi:hypothetical protein